MILDTKKERLLAKYCIPTEMWELTPTEFRFLLGLLSNELVTFDKLAEFVLKGKDIKYPDKYLSNLCTRVKDKTGLNIEVHKGFGYTLKDEVEII